MKHAVLAALVLATPLAAFAQGTGQGAGTAQGPIPQREPNLANPQARANQQFQPPQAHRDSDTGQANTIPTPTLSHPMTSTDTQPGPPPGPIAR